MKRELKETLHLKWDRDEKGNMILGNYGIRKVIDYDYQVYMYEVYNDFYKDKPSIKRFFKKRLAKLFVELLVLSFYFLFKLFDFISN